MWHSWLMKIICCIIKFQPMVISNNRGSEKKYDHPYKSTNTFFVWLAGGGGGGRILPSLISGHVTSHHSCYLTSSHMNGEKSCDLTGSHVTGNPIWRPEPEVPPRHFTKYPCLTTHWCPLPGEVVVSRQWPPGARLHMRFHERLHISKCIFVQSFIQFSFCKSF